MSITEEIKKNLIRKEQLTEEISSLNLPIFDKFRDSDEYYINDIDVEYFVYEMEEINGSPYLKNKISTDNLKKEIVEAYEKEADIYKNLHEEYSNIKDKLFSIFFQNRKDINKKDIFTSIYLVEKKGNLNKHIEEFINNNCEDIFFALEEKKNGKNIYNGLIFAYNENDIIAFLKKLSNEEYRLKLKGDDIFKVKYDDHNLVLTYDYLIDWNSYAMLGSNMNEIVNKENLLENKNELKI